MIEYLTRIIEKIMKEQEKVQSKTDLSEHNYGAQVSDGGTRIYSKNKKLIKQKALDLARKEK